MTPGRNEPCLCGSGKKWKRCCGSPEVIRQMEAEDTRAREEQRQACLREAGSHGGRGARVQALAFAVALAMAPRR
jgi:hypothetical protein